MTRWSFLFVVFCGFVFAIDHAQRHDFFDLPEAASYAATMFLFGCYVALVAYFGRDDRSDESIVARERRARRAARSDARERLPLALQVFLAVVLANTIAAMHVPTGIGFAIATAVGLVFGSLAHRWVAGVPGFFD